MSEQEHCSCRTCSPALEEAGCAAMTQTMIRFNERSSFTANQAMDHNGLVGLQFQARGIQELQKDTNSSSELLTLIASLGGINNRVGGINPS